MTVENLNITVKTNADKAAAKLLTLGSALDKVQGSAASVGGGAGARAAKGVEQVGKAAEKANKPMNNFLSSLKRIAFYRIIRGIIKSITSAFQEGLEKAYLFSSSMSGEGNRFAAAMDRMKSAGNQMKGQLGSAFISLLAAVEPILITLINLVTKVADAISQLFAAFTGRTYLKANATAAQFANNMKSGGRAAKEWKNQLLGFDEINRLNEPSNGGGGGGSNPLAGYEYAATDISEFWMDVANKLRKIFGDIKGILRGVIDFIAGVFTGDWDRAFHGLAEIVSGVGSLISDIITNLWLPAFDGLSQKGIENIGKLFDFLSEKTGVDLSGIKEAVIYALNYIRFYVEAIAIKISWIVQDLCDAVSKAIDGDWEGAWAAAKKAASDASVDIVPAVADMAEEVTKSMMDGARSAASAANGTSYAANGVSNSLATTANNSADFAEIFMANLDAARGAAESFGQTEIGATANENGLSFWARTQRFFGNIFRMMPLSAPATDWGSIIPKFATGGFPDEGQLFIANEAGAELVGTMGGRTAVANSDSIVEGIRQGVYDAVIAANNNGSGDVSVRVYLDSREIKAGQQRLNRAWGV